MKKIITTLLIICLLASCTTKDRRVCIRPCIVLDKHTHIWRGMDKNCLYIYDGNEAQHYLSYDSSYNKLNIGDTLTIIQLITIHQ